MWCSNCGEDRLMCDRRQCTAGLVAYECLHCGHRETEKRNNISILNFPVTSYRRLTAEEFVADGWALRPETVWTEGHTGHHNEGGGAIYRLMQIISVEIRPGNDYLWTAFDFETGQIKRTTCWGSGPTLYVILDENAVGI